MSARGNQALVLLRRFDTNGFETRIAGEVKGFNPELYIEKKEIKKMDLFIQYAMGAAHEAIEDSRLEITPENADRIGVIVWYRIGRDYLRLRSIIRSFSKKGQVGFLLSSFLC